MIDDVRWCSDCGHPDFTHHACKGKCDVEARVSDPTTPCDCKSFRDTSLESMQFCSKCGHSDLCHHDGRGSCDLGFDDDGSCDCESFLPETEPL